MLALQLTGKHSDPDLLGGLVCQPHRLAISTKKARKLLASEFFDIPPTSPGSGLTGYYATAEYGVYRSHQSGQSMNRALITATHDAGDNDDESVCQAISHPTVENEVKPDPTAQDPVPPQSMNFEPLRNLQSFSRMDWTGLR
jgi:hypothetical protein